MNLYTALLITALVGLGAATRCYVCNGAGNSDCGDTYEGDPSHEVDCFAAGMEDDGCTKYKTKKENAFGFFSTTIERKCGSAYDNLFCEGFVRKENNVLLDDRETHIFACSCTGDLCNSAQLGSASVGLLLLSIAAAWIMM